MLKRETIDLGDTGVLNQLVADYLNRKKELKPFYRFEPDAAGLKNALEADHYAGLDRERLSRILLKQSEKVGNTSEQTKKQISALAQPKTFTLTTGHQLCLFTGPL